MRTAFLAGTEAAHPSIPMSTVATAASPLADDPGVVARDRRLEADVAIHEDARERPTTLTVVVVEDHLETAEGLAELLRLWGHRPHVAHDGEYALALVQDVRPDVALVDIELPRMNGNELATRIRALEIGPEMLLVAVTGLWDTGLIGAAFDRHLEKPVALDVLERLLNQHARLSR